MKRNLYRCAKKTFNLKTNKVDSFEYKLGVDLF